MDKSGIHELISHWDVRRYRLLAQLNTKQDLRDAMLHIQEGGLIALVVLQNPFPENQ